MIRLAKCFAAIFLWVHTFIRNVKTNSNTTQPSHKDDVTAAWFKKLYHCEWYNKKFKRKQTNLFAGCKEHHYFGFEIVFHKRPQHIQLVCQWTYNIILYKRFNNKIYTSSYSAESNNKAMRQKSNSRSKFFVQSYELMRTNRVAQSMKDKLKFAVHNLFHGYLDRICLKFP